MGTLCFPALLLILVKISFIHLLSGYAGHNVVIWSMAVKKCIENHKIVDNVHAFQHQGVLNSF